MIAKSHRFHGHNSLKVVYQNGRTVRGSMLGLRYLRNEPRSDYRAAVVVSRKVHKSAVARNRLRRRLYEQLRLLAPQFTEPHDLILTVFSDGLAELKPTELNRSVEGLLKKAHVIPEQGTTPRQHAIVEPKERARH